MAGAVIGAISAAPTIISGIAGLVHGVEQLFGKGNGAAKKAAVQSALSGAITAYDGTATVVSNKLPIIQDVTVSAAISKLIDDVVELSNALGVFQKAAAASPATQAVAV